jgi:hypothetical protein
MANNRRRDGAKTVAKIGEKVSILNRNGIVWSQKWGENWG